MTFSDALDLFLYACHAMGLAPSTLRWYSGWLGQFRQVFGTLALSDLSRQHISEYLVRLRQRDTRYPQHPHHPTEEGGLSVFTINGQVRALRSFFSWLVREGHLSRDHNPMIGFKLARLPRRAPRSVSRADLIKLLELTEGDTRSQRRDRAILCFLADTGCRAGGLVNLTLNNLDLDRCIALVTEKGSKSRYVVFTEITRRALRRWLEVRPTDRGDWVFLSFQRRQQLTYTGLHQMLERLKLRAGISGRVNPHSFRHGFAREYLFNGGDLATLADLMGHADVKTTREFYTIYTIEELARLHRKFSPLSHLDNLTTE